MGKDPTNITFDGDELQKLKRLASAYAQAKTLVLYAEEVDPSSRSNLQTIKEFRDALDHVMKVFLDKSGLEPAPGGQADYCVENVEKAIGHIYRASFDALDGAVLSLKELIAKELERYSPDVVAEVIKDYWEMKLKLNKLVNQVSAHRANKDVSLKTDEALNGYVRDVDAIKELYDKILTAGPAMINEEQRRAS